MTRSRYGLLLAITLALGACSNTDPVDDDSVPTNTLDRATLCAPDAVGDGEISGSVSFSTDPVLPREHDLLYIELQDISLQDAPSVRIAGQCIDEPGLNPQAFALAYDLAAIASLNDYNLSATLYRSDDGVNYRLGYTDDQIRPVLTRGFNSEAYPVLIPVNP